MNIINFDLYKNLLKEKSGLILSEDKSYLIESRLTPVAKKWNYDTLDAMTSALQGVPDPKLIEDIVEAMTTNETSFFRDTRPFDIFRDTVLKYMKNNRGSKRLRIWCAAASSGQEPYTLAIILKELAAEFPGWSFEIIGTDISKDILAQAEKGSYSQFEVQRGMPITLLMKYFTQVEDRWEINSEIKSMIKYQPFNLLDSMASLGKFDIVFCRNVLIYFDQETKGDVLNRIKNQLESDGFLFLGGAETVIGLTDAFKVVPDKRGLYALTAGPHFGEGSTLSSQALA
ncbi:MAG: chemotaxis protein CheR [Micavibrio sp. TMED27]|nr:chemotaxis protein CheR [Micavibrio sp.]OUT90789.1 MAG: chemotaxis protein CheR [Micavibrio sp. TMED27]|tara:strand:+ start:3097 stop:3954 length:858 start_codon:yes stop_codon:yes gene_type:complete